MLLHLSRVLALLACLTLASQALSQTPGANRIRHSLGTTAVAFFYTVPYGRKDNATFAGEVEPFVTFAGVAYELSYEFPSSRLYLAGNVSASVGIDGDVFFADESSTELTVTPKFYARGGVKVGLRVSKTLKMYGSIGYYFADVSTDGDGVYTVATADKDAAAFGFGLVFGPKHANWNFDWNVLEISSGNTLISSINASYKF